MLTVGSGEIFILYSLHLSAHIINKNLIRAPGMSTKNLAK